MLSREVRVDRLGTKPCWWLSRNFFEKHSRGDYRHEDEARNRALRARSIIRDRALRPFFGDRRDDVLEEIVGYSSFVVRLLRKYVSGKLRNKLKVLKNIRDILSGVRLSVECNVDSSRWISSMVNITG